MSLKTGEYEAPVSAIDAEFKTRQKTVDEAVDQICQLLLRDISNNVSLDELADKSGWSVRSITYAFVRRYAMPPKKWLLNERLRYAREILLTTDNRISLLALSEELGFASASKFATYYRRAYGETPRDTLRRSKEELSRVA